MTKKKTSPTKSALSTPPKPTVPAELYTHVDPLLRRLRLVNAFGESVNLQREFRDTEVVAFLFGAEWGVGGGRGRRGHPMYDALEEMGREKRWKFKIIFVSLDSEKGGWARALEGREWLGMEWEDGTDLPQADPADIPASLPTPALARDESFLLPSEDPNPSDTDPLAPSSDTDLPPDAYTRPFSRGYLTFHRGVLAVPTLMVYNVKKHKWLSSKGGIGVRADILRKGRREATWAKWVAGETAEIGLRDIMLAMRWTLALCFLAVVYILAVRADDSYNVVHLVEKFMNMGADPGAGSVPRSVEF